MTSRVSLRYGPVHSNRRVIPRNPEAPRGWSERRGRIALFAILVLFLFGGPRAWAATIVSGPITANTTWTIGGSPYVLNGIVTVNSGRIWASCRFNCCTVIFERCIPKM